MHYQRTRDNDGDPGPAQKLTTWGENRGKACGVEGCPNPIRAAGWCEMHYRRNHDKGDPGSAEPMRRALPEEMKGYTLGQRHRFYKYGLTTEAFDALLAEQGGRCYVCLTETPTAKGWSVDHCHETNSVRFIACNPCNAALGLIREDPEIAKRLWYVAIECQARKGAEVRAADLVAAMVALHPDLVTAATT
jgi:hypothetical protein